jgi:multidrug efflux pump subunit AcrB
VIGILVDDAIVEIENIMRHLQMGKSPYQAAMEAADEIGLAVVATTFTLIAVFLPTAFMSGMVGKFFVQFGWTAAIAVWFSLVVARMLTPMMAAYLLKPPKRAHTDPRWMAPYLKLAAWCLKHRLWTLLAVVVFGVVSCAPLVAGKIPGAFIPPDDLSQTQVAVTMPPGATFAQTLAATEQAEALVRAHPHVKLIYTAIGGGKAGADPFMSAGAAESNKATLTLNLTPRDQRPGITKQAIEADLRQAMDALPARGSRWASAARPRSSSWCWRAKTAMHLTAHARVVEQELRTLPGIGNVTSTSSLQRPELAVRPDNARAADLGVTSAAIADTLRVATAGDYEQALAKLNLAQRQVPVVVRLPDSARQDLALLERLPVPGARGPVPLANVATLEVTSGPAQIDRYDRLRNVNFEIELNGQPLGTVQAQADQLPSLQNLPPGIIRTVVGDAEAMGELLEGFGLAMATGVLCIYIVLVLLFHAWVQPATILVALVLSIPGPSWRCTSRARICRCRP